MKNTLLLLSGFYCIGFALFHLLFWRIFRWKSDLERIMPINKAIMQVLNLQLTFVFLFFAVAIFLFNDELINTASGKFIIGSMSVFWFIRAVNQILFFDKKNYISLIIFFVFIIGGLLFLVPIL